MKNKQKQYESELQISNTLESGNFQIDICVTYRFVSLSHFFWVHILTSYKILDHKILHDALYYLETWRMD